MVQLPTGGFQVLQVFFGDLVRLVAALFRSFDEIWSRVAADCPPAVVVDGAPSKDLVVLGVVLGLGALIVEGVGETDPLDR